MCMPHRLVGATGLSCRRRIRLGRITIELVTLLALAASSSHALAANGTWINTTSGGLWSATGNWSGGIVANGQDGIADFSTLHLLTDDTVHLDSARTIGTLKFGDTGASHNWFLDNNGTGADILTLGVSSGSPTITVVNGTATISAVLAGTQGFTETGGGTLTLDGNNTFTGGVTINAGVIILGNPGALNSTSPNAVTFGSGSTGDLALVRQSVTISALSSNGGTPVVENGSNVTAVTLSVNNAVANTYGGVLEDGGAASLALSKSGAGTLLLAGANTYTGGTTISAGTLQLGDGTTSNGSVTGNITDNAALGFANPNAQSYASVISGSGSVTKSGAGTLTLSGNNSFTGGLTVQQGTLAIATINNVSTNGTLGNNTSVTLGSSAQTGTLEYTGATASNSMPFTLAASGTGAFQIDTAATNLSLSGVIAGTGSLTKSGPGTLTLSGSSSFSGTTTISAGTLQLGDGTTNNGSVAGNITDNAALAFANPNAQSYAGVISGTGSLTKSGPGTLTLSGSSSFSGTTTISAGTLQLGDGTTNNGSVAGNITDNAALAFANPNAQSYAGVISGAGYLTMSGPGTLILSGNNSFTGGVEMLGGTLTLSGNNTFNGGFVYVTGGTLTLSGNNSFSFVEMSGGTLTLSGNNSFTGGVDIFGGTLKLASTGALNATTPNAVAFFGPTGTLSLAGNNVTVSSLTGNGIVQNASVSGATLTISNTGADSFTGVLQDGAGGGSLALVKTGAGALTLGGTSSYSGTTTISSGILISPNTTALGTSKVVLNGGTLRTAPVITSSLAGFGGTSTSVTGAGTGWAVNNTAITSNPINSNVLTLTDGAFGEARAAYSNTLQPIALGPNGFNASFTYTPSSPNLATTAADGVVFILQNDARGLNAIGGFGGGFAYTSENGATAVQPSVAIALNIWSGHVIGTNLLTNGNPNGDTYLPVTPVNLISGNPIDVSACIQSSRPNDYGNA